MDTNSVRKKQGSFGQFNLACSRYWLRSQRRSQADGGLDNACDGPQTAGPKGSYTKGRQSVQMLERSKGSTTRKG